MGLDFVCLASLSGNNNSHVGDCTSVYSNKICCRIADYPTADTCSAKVVSDKLLRLNNTDIQLCSGANVNYPPDPCYSICWRGAGMPNLTSTNWKCSVCYDSGNNPVSCSTLPGATFNWLMPTGYVEDTDYTLVSGTLTSANPVINFTNLDNNRVVTLNVYPPTGSSCSGQNSAQLLLPIWREISPFK